MNACRRVRKVVSRICAAAFFCAATLALAQAVHRQVDAQGHITFSDRADATPSPAAPMVPALDAAKTPAGRSTISSRRAALIESNEAERRLLQARRARAQGVQPLPDERARNTDAHVVNHRYWRRQEKLRHEVEQALRRSNETQRTLHASR